MKSEITNIEYIVLKNADLKAQLECYTFLKEFYGSAFGTFNEIKTIVSEYSPYIYIDLSSKRIKRCEAREFTPEKDLYVTTIKDFKKEVKERVKPPVNITVGTLNAVISDQYFVTVGCQNISFKQVEEVYNAMLKFK